MYEPEDANALWSDEGEYKLFFFQYILFLEDSEFFVYKTFIGVALEYGFRVVIAFHR